MSNLTWTTQIRRFLFNISRAFLSPSANLAQVASSQGLLLDSNSGVLPNCSSTNPELGARDWSEFLNKLNSQNLLVSPILAVQVLKRFVSSPDLLVSPIWFTCCSAFYTVCPLTPSILFVLSFLLFIYVWFFAVSFKFHNR